MNMHIDILAAEQDFSQPIQLLESGAEESITTTRDGKPVIVMNPYNQVDVSKRIGIAKGKFNDPEDFDLYESIEL